MPAPNTSHAHQIYLRGEKRKRKIVTLLRWGLLVVLLGLWELLATLGVIDTFLMSCPSRIATTLYKLTASGELFVHIGYTLYETVTGFLIATTLGTLIASVLWWFETARNVLEPYVIVLNGLPKIALGPILIVWAGAGTGAIVAMTVLICIVITVIDMLAGFTAVDKEKRLLMQTMHASRLQTFTKLVLPANVSTLISVLKVNVGLSWVGSIMGEYLVSRAGLGYLIVYGGQVFKLDLVMASTVILCALAGVMYSLVVIIEKKVKKHHLA